MNDKVVHRQVFVFNEEDNGGESLMLTTTYYDNGDPITENDDGIFANQELTLNSYCNSASFNLAGTGLNPDNLRRLANELEKSQAIARLKKMKGDD